MLARRAPVRRNLAIAFLLFSSAASASGQLSSDASREQCTCDLGDYKERAGAQVVNAASCVRVPRYPWCDIYLATTEDSQEHATLLGELRDIQEAQDLVELLGSLLREYVAAKSEERPELSDELGADTQAIETIIPESYAAISRCLVGFQINEPAGGETRNVDCSVGRESGWLRISFRLEVREYTFLFAPGGERR